MSWFDVIIGGKPARVWDSEQPLPPVILFLHDARGTPPDAIGGFTELLVRYRWCCLAPAGGCSWWLQHICADFDPQISPETHVMERIVPWMQQRWQVQPQRLAIVGVGMGGQGAVRLGLRHPDQFPIVGSIDGALDLQDAWGYGTPLDTMYPNAEAARRDSAIMHLQERQWPEAIWLACSPGSFWYRGNDRLHEKLTAHGVPHQAILHQERSPEEFLPDLFGFLHDKFVQLSRRLL
jgi:pimeloyl-ACP methyl ester carboxylesterase